MGRVIGCESCGSMDSKHAADIYDVPDVLMCWECETGALFEQERIIKLLEGYQGLTGMFALERDDLIALIKGENK